MLHEMYDGLMIMDDFDDCIIGMIRGIDTGNKVCYSYNKVIAKLIADDEMEEIDAIEHFEYNMIGAYVGENTPVFLFEEGD